MLKVINRKKSKLLPIIILSIMLSACKNNDKVIENDTKKNNIVVENNINLEINKNYYAVYKTDEFVSIKKSLIEQKEDFNQDTIDDINEHISKYRINTLMLDSVDNEFDLNKINLDYLTNITLNKVDNKFDYKPLYNHEYEYIKIFINKDNNFEEQIKFLDNIKYKEALIELSFEDDELEIPQLYINELAMKDNIYSLTIDTNKATELDFSKLNVNSLIIYNHETNQVVSHNINVSDNLTNLSLQSYYDRDYKESTVVKEIKVNSNSESLEIKLNFIHLGDDDYTIFVTDQTKISVPNNTKLEIYNINTFIKDDEWYNQFKDTYSTMIINKNPNMFIYQNGIITIEDAIELYKDELQKITLKKI